MWLVCFDGYIYKVKTVDEVANLVFKKTGNWMFASSLRDILPEKEIDWEEDFEDSNVYIWKYR